jgi:RNA polymerase sigma factor (sigma-70 family)
MGIGVVLVLRFLPVLQGAFAVLAMPPSPTTENPATWEKVFARFAGRLLVYVCHRMGGLGEHCTGEDIVQEVFLAAFKSIGAEELGAYSLYARLRRIADHCMGDLVRRMAAEKRGGDRVTLSLEGWDPYGQSAVMGKVARPWLRQPTRPSVRAVKKEDFEKALEALRLLSSPQAQVFFLRWYEGLSVAEIAERLTLSRDAVYKRLARAAREITALARGV